MTTHRTDECILFVDNSNIWIEAQKYAFKAMRLRENGRENDSGQGQDPRIRIDLRALVEIVRAGRTLRDSSIYISGLSPDANHIKAFGNMNLTPQFFSRTGKEKEVDTSIAWDMGCLATRLDERAKSDDEARREKDNVTFIVASGDRDMCRPVRGVLEMGFNVEVWAWSESMSTMYEDLSSEDNRLKVSHLDGFFHHVTFLNNNSTRKGRPPPGKTLVLCEFPSQAAMTEEWYIEVLDSLGHVFFVWDTLKQGHIGIDFPRADIDDMISLTRKWFGGALTVLSWPEYANSSGDKHRASLGEPGQFTSLGDQGIDGDSPPEVEPEALADLKEDEAFGAITGLHLQDEAAAETRRGTANPASQTATPGWNGSIDCLLQKATDKRMRKIGRQSTGGRTYPTGPGPSPSTGSGATRGTMGGT